MIEMGSYSLLTLVSLAILIGLLLLYFIWRFSVLERSSFVYLAFVYISIFFCFYGMILLPVDIASTQKTFCLASNQREGECPFVSNFVPQHILVAIWRAIYWSIMILTWLVFPICKSYCTSGHFTVLRKLRETVIVNSIYYAVLLVGFIGLLIAMLVNKEQHTRVTPESIRTLLAAVSNTLGVLLLILVLGHGLVDIPRSVWSLAEVDTQYRRALLYISATSEQIHLYEQRVKKNVCQLVRAHSDVGLTPGLGGYVQQIISKLPQEMRHKVLRGECELIDDVSHEMITISTSFKAYLLDLFGFQVKNCHQELDYNNVDLLVDLHYDVLQNVMHLARYKRSLSCFITKALYYKDIISNSHHSTQVYRKTLTQRNWFRCALPRWFGQLEWYYYVRVRKHLLKAVAILLGACSLVIIFSETTLFLKKPVLSIPALIIGTLDSTNANPMVGQLFSFLVLVFLSLSTYRTVFRIRLFRIMQLFDHHRTTTISFLSCASVVCFFFPPICLNYLNLIQYDQNSFISQNRTVQTAFTMIMGPFNVVPLISEYFFTYYPCFLLAVCLLSLLTFIPAVNKVLPTQDTLLFVRNSQDMIAEGELIIRQCLSESRLYFMDSLEPLPVRSPIESRDLFNVAGSSDSLSPLIKFDARSDSSRGV